MKKAFYKNLYKFKKKINDNHIVNLKCIKFCVNKLSRGEKNIFLFLKFYALYM